MSFKVQVGLPQISIHQGQTVLVSEQNGQINWPSEKGLYFLDTRVVSNWAIYANGESWELLNGGPVTHHAARIFLTNRAILAEDGAISPRTVGLTISRWISGGLHEDLDITNNGMKPIRFQLEILPDCATVPRLGGPGKLARVADGAARPARTRQGGGANRCGDRAGVFPCSASCSGSQTGSRTGTGPRPSHCGGLLFRQGVPPHATYLFKH
jgi:N-terminal domain of (some) glycogen debranching enzymes